MRLSAREIVRLAALLPLFTRKLDCYWPFLYSICFLLSFFGTRERNSASGAGMVQNFRNFVPRVSSARTPCFARGGIVTTPPNEPAEQSPIYFVSSNSGLNGKKRQRKDDEDRSGVGRVDF